MSASSQPFPRLQVQMDALALLVLSFVLRLPFFFPAVIDWDESTFILMGQSLLDGQLPYTQLWDVKPPLLFGFFAGALALIGHDIRAVRLAGTVCVAATAMLVYLIARRHWARGPSLTAAVWCVLGICTTDAGQATMSEHVMLPALLGSVYLLVAPTHSPARTFVVGMLVSAAALIRLNATFAVLAVGAIVLIDAARGRSAAQRGGAMFVAGGALTLFATCVPYAVSGRLTLLWTSAVVAPFARAESGQSIWHNLTVHGRHLFGLELGERGIVSALNVLLSVGALLGVLVIVLDQRTPTSSRRAFVRVGVVALAIAVSILLSGGDYSHYLIQVMPFAALFAAALIEYATSPGRWLIWAVTGALASFSVEPVVAEYRSMWSRRAQAVALPYGPAYEIAAYLARENPTGRPVYMLSDHVAHFLTHSVPPTRLVTHPSTITRHGLLASLGTNMDAELAKVFATTPLFVVLRDAETAIHGLRPHLDPILARDYRLVLDIQGRQIYRRKAIDKQ